MFLAFVCRRRDIFIDEKEHVLLPVAGELLVKDFRPCHKYMVLACNALSYLTYDSCETCVAVLVRIRERLVELTFHKSSSVSVLH